MKLSYHWLKEFVKLEGDAQMLADELTMKTAEVEEIIPNGKDITKLVVGEILEIKPHPKADKVQLTKVSVGDDTLEIVCGDQNIKVGQKVPTALIGATLPGDFKITEREIRGVKSHGMLVSAKELGLPGDASGILILDPTAKVGSDVKTLLGLDDTTLELDVLPDRSYLLSHIGAARDISAIRGTELTMEGYGQVGTEAITNSQQANNTTIEIENQADCPRYSSVLLSNLRIGASPTWLASRLERLGVRSVNNLVDLTNYVMLELGQPLHAFDRAKLGSNTIEVRRAKKGESLDTLDGETRKLDENNLVITDDKKPLAVAGVMGGVESEISATTSGVLIESANFNQVTIRRSSQALKLRSEASVRYERWLDPNLTAVALARLVELLPQVGLGEVTVSQLVDHYPAPLVRQPFTFDPSQIARLAGVQVEVAEQVRILQQLGMTVSEDELESDGQLLVTPPSYRHDVNSTADLVEEIVRVYGYERVPKTLPSAKLVPSVYEADRHWSRKVKNLLRGASFTEIETYSFVGKNMLEQLEFDPKEHIELANPISPELAYMRGSLIPNALETVKKNAANGYGHMRFFELGRTYRRARGKEFPLEPLMLTAVEVSAERISGNDQLTGTTQDAPEWTFLAQVLESIIFHFGLDPGLLKRSAFVGNKAFHHGRTALLELGDTNIGVLAEIHPTALSKLGIDRRVAVLDVRFEELMKLAKGERAFVPLAKYPAVTRDISVAVPESITASDVVKAIKAVGSGLVHQVNIFDRYAGKDLLERERGYAFRMTMRAKDHSLKEAEIKKVESSVSKKLTQLGVKIR